MYEIILYDFNIFLDYNYKFHAAWESDENELHVLEDIILLKDSKIYTCHVYT